MKPPKKGSVNVPEVSVILRRGDKVLFIQRQNTGYGDGLYCLPCGHVEHGESYSAAAVRETLEETGIAVAAGDIRPVFIMQRVSAPGDIRTGLIFEALDWLGEPQHTEPEHHGPPVWFDANKLPYSKIVQFQAESLKALQHGEIYSELGWLEPAIDHHKQLSSAI